VIRAAPPSEWPFGRPRGVDPAAIVFPGTERAYDVTRVAGAGHELDVWARIPDASVLEPNEQGPIRVRIDQRTGDVVAPFVDRELSLSG